MKTIILFLALSFYSFVSAQHKTEIFFAFDRDELDQSEQQKLEAWISSNPGAEIKSVFGYCDRFGTYYYNDSLSLRRARTVYEILKMNALTFASDFTLRGFGENFMKSGIDAENRKVSIFYNPSAPLATHAEPSALEQKITQASVGEKIKLDQLQFFNMSDEIVPSSQPRLKELLSVMRGNPGLRIEIQGHICCQTVREKDYSYVSTMRAKSVYDYLVRNGVARERLSYKGFGVSRPIHSIPEKSDKEADENRRVEIEVLSN